MGFSSRFAAIFHLFIVYFLLVQLLPACRLAGSPLIISVCIKICYGSFHFMVVLVSPQVDIPLPKYGFLISFDRLNQEAPLLSSNIGQNCSYTCWLTPNNFTAFIKKLTKFLVYSCFWINFTRFLIDITGTKITLYPSCL